MVCSSITVILKPMKMTLTEQYERAWAFLLRWGTSILVCNRKKAFNSLFGSVYILGLSLWGRWEGKDGRSCWHWVRSPTFVLASKH
jgi:hypothetical protein